LKDALGNITQTNQVLSEMKVNLLQSAAAEKNAILADTDEASKAFADQSLQAAAAVNEARLKLRQLARESGISEEIRQVDEFDSCWTELQKIDHVLLGLAVQNTNIKAARLSYTKANQAMERFEKALGKLMEVSLSDPEKIRIVQLACQALFAGHRVLGLQLPHILASSDEKMDEIEADMRRAAEQVNGSLGALDDLVNEKSKAPLAEAEKAFREFEEVNAEVIELSRQNTNIKSIELSVGKKRMATAQCEQILGALQETVRSRTFKATK
jgi:hypothetical protein